MKRDYQVGVKDDVEFFTGIEIERSPAFGLMTLFVVGVHPSEDIIKMAEEKNCEAIYFGANQSFPNPTAITLASINIWKEWETMIKNVLTSTKIYCTLDIDIKCLTCFQGTELNNYNRFIPMISVKLPNVESLNYNTTVKIDDTDFDDTNPGIWCHSLNSLMNRKNFTSWCEYKNDKPI